MQQMERLSLQDGQLSRSLRVTVPSLLPTLRPRLRQSVRERRPLWSSPSWKPSRTGRPSTHSLRSLSRRRPPLQQEQAAMLAS